MVVGHGYLQMLGISGWSVTENTETPTTEAQLPEPLAEEVSMVAVPDENLKHDLPGLCLRFKWGKCKNKCCRYIHDESQRVPPLPPKYSRSTASAAGTYTLSAEAAPKTKKAWRSVDWLLNGQSVKSQPYLKAFAESSWLSDLLQREGCASLFNKRGRPLRKEVTESFGVLYAVRRALAKLDIGGAPNDCTIIDACCGKGLASLVLAQALPGSVVHAIDNDPRMDLSHFQEQQNIIFHEMDLHSEKTSCFVASAAAEAQAQARTVVLVGTHLCGALSPRLIELFLNISGPAALVLSPCCLDGRRPMLKEAARRLRVEPHRYWCHWLLWSLPVDGSKKRRELLIDDDVISDRNTFILATSNL